MKARIALLFASLAACGSGTAGESTPPARPERPVARVAETDHSCDRQAPELVRFIDRTRPGHARELVILASGAWKTGGDSGCLSAGQLESLDSLIGGVSEFYSTRCSQAFPSYDLSLPGGWLSWSIEPRCGRAPGPAVTKLAETLAAIPSRPWTLRARPGLPQCSPYATALVHYLIDPDDGFKEGVSMRIKILSSGAWTHDAATGCLDAKDLQDVSDLAGGVKLRIKSSDQSCPRPASNRFTLTVAGNKKPLVWADGGCGTELDPTVDALLKRIISLTAP